MQCAADSYIDFSLWKSFIVGEGKAASFKMAHRGDFGMIRNLSF